MNNRILSLIIAAALIFNSITAVLAAKSCNPKADEYTIKDNVNMIISRIELGEVANISIDMKDDNIKTDEISSPDNIEISGTDGSFGSPDADSVEITSSAGENLKYTINFKNVTYSGTGSSISFKVKYKDLNLTSEKITLNINECSEKDNSNENINSETNRQPYVEIGRSNIETPVKANEEFTLYLTVKNRGSAKMKRPVMTISLPDSIDSLEGTGNIQMPDIEAGTSRNISLKLKASDYIQSASEEIDINLNYNYESGSNGLISGSYNDRIFIPMKATAKTSAPIVQISRGSIKTPIEGNQEFILPITIKNTGSTSITLPQLSISPSDEIILMDDSAVISLNDLKPKEETTTSIRLKTKKYISSSAQEITAELKYNYKSENDDLQAKESTKLIIPTQPNDEGAEPLLHIVTENIDNPLKSNEKFSIKVTINNIGSTNLNAGVLNWEPGDGIILTDKTASVNIGSLKAGASKEITLKGKTGDKLSSTTQVLNGELTYKYENSKNTAQGSETIKIILPTEPESETTFNNATPNIIVNQYNYGGVPIANGSTFNFDVSFKNTSKTTPIENIVMSIETDAGLSIHSASNTYYYEKIPALGVKSQSIGMQVLPSAETGSVKLTINFSYEYVENSERKQISSSQNVSIPVYKPDKLEITLDPLPSATVGIEQTVNLNYVNKGKGDLSNVKAEITGNITALTSVQNLGNFESGKSGTITFVVVPEVPGEANFTIKVSYEDANLEQKTLEFPCTMNVEDYVDNMEQPEEFPEEETSSHSIWKIVLSVIGAAILILIIFIILRKRKKKKLSETVKVNWEAEDEDK
ncbi:MAG: hypothetical protein Q4D26_00715 [Clostridia bacterium]|nr:hypothetical protein [Clostridia bacterium]